MAIAGPALTGACVLSFAPAQASASSLNRTSAALETAARSSGSLVAGVQDSWINDCDSDPYEALLPGQTDRAHGYADNSVPAVDSRYWVGLGMHTVRFSPTWDIAYQRLSGNDATAVSIERTCFNYWLGRLAAKGVSAEVAFKPDYCFRNPAGCPDNQTGHVVIPTLSQYEAAMSAFLAAYPQIKVIAPWGEPDFQPGGSEPNFAIGHAGGANFGQASCVKPTVSNCGPELAAQMWTVLRHRCSSCTVIAGDFGGNESQDAAYFSEYKKYLRDISGGHQVYHPAVWGIHPYSDTETAEREIQSSGRVTRLLSSTLVAHFAGWLAADRYGSNTRIWLDEISSFTNSSFSLQTQRAGGQYLFDRLPHAPKTGQPRVTRIYYMRFEGATSDSLINGTPRPIYFAVQNRPKHALPQDVAPSSAPAAAKPKAAAGSAAPSHPAAAKATSAAAAPGSAAVTTRFEVRNRADNFCLDANDLGLAAGQNGDAVRLWTCYGGTNQEWIPQYKAGQLAWLVSAKYPGMCLNANNVGGLANGRRVQLWNCYMASNELWNVGTLMASPAGSPLFLGTGGSGSLTLDADKYSLGNGDKVQVWAYYAGSTQLWVPVSA